MPAAVICPAVQRLFRESRAGGERLRREKPATRQGLPLTGRERNAKMPGATEKTFGCSWVLRCRGFPAGISCPFCQGWRQDAGKEKGRYKKGNKRRLPKEGIRRYLILKQIIGRRENENAG